MIRLIKTVLVALATSILGMSMAYPASASELFVRANQAGYSIDSAKSAIVFGDSSFPDAYSIVKMDSGEEVFRGNSKTLSGNAWGKWSNHVELDFSVFKTPGRFQLRFGGAESF
ncbi:MAG TPA: cellulase N-terminal Ig-like domain-containing protein, partial [Verrucomicrobiae bacterium]|nr:cellulase N-terminal Ig-like domain-containing protein [Verrucomicrobiae bacterium]